MSIIEHPALVTEEQLLEMAAQRDRRVEVSDGEIIDVSLNNIEHVLITGEIYDRLKLHVRAVGLGLVFGDSLIYILARGTEGDITISRIPDCSFVRKERFTASMRWDKPFEGAPDLAIEVLSPSDTHETIAGRIEEYLTYGGSEVWIVSPMQKTLHQHTTDRSLIRVYRVGDALDADPLLPGLQIAIADLFVDPLAD